MKNQGNGCQSHLSDSKLIDDYSVLFSTELPEEEIYQGQVNKYKNLLLE